MIKLVKMPMLEKVILLGFYLSGFAALTYEQVWTQLLFLVFGASTYAFSVMLTAFFIGLALGSHIMGRYVDRIEFPILWFSFIELGIGLFGLVLLPAFSMLDLSYLLFFQKIDSPYLFMLSWALLPFWLLIPTTLMGATIPLVSKIFVSEREKIGAHMGLLYSANTLGGVVGSFSAGFILIPYLGLVKTCVLAALANIIVAFVIFSYSEGLLHVQGIYKTRKARYFISMKRGFYFFLAVSLLLSFHISSYKINPTFAGAYYAGMRMATIDEWKEAKEGFDILYDKYGRYGLVVVGEDENDVRYLSVNGKTEASTGLSDMPTQYLIAYIPMLVHKDPEKVLNIGLGAGFTLSAIENFDVEKIDVIEIDPTLVKVAEEYFSEYTHNVLDDPRLNLVIADGRNYLHTSKEQYDVIISEPSNPWISGEGNLFTKEFFEIVRGHLNEDGIFCQWAPMYEHDVEDFKILLKTFHSVFPYVQVYNSGTDIILLGSNNAMDISYPRLTEKLEDPEISRDFNEISILARQTTSSNIDEFLSTYKMGSDDVHEYVKGDIRLNTDEHTVLEFRTALNAVKSRYSDDLSVVVDPLRDMLNFMTKRHGSPVVTPPLSGLVSSENSTDVIRILNIEIERQSDWTLDTYKCEYMHRIGPGGVLMYSSNRYVKYRLPNQGVQVVTLVDAYSLPGIEEVENLIGNTFGFDFVGYRDEVVVNGHTAYLLVVSLKGGSVRGLSLAWHCDENNVLYMATVVYPSENWDWVDGVEAVSNVRCIHDV